MSNYSQPLLRYGLVLLFLWFGYQQLVNPSAWVSFLPEFLGYIPVPGEMIVQMNGWFEVVFALLLALGCYTRLIALALGAHLLGIAAIAGGAIGMRDFTLSIACFSLSLAVPDAYTYDSRQKTAQPIKQAQSSQIS